MNEAIFKSIKCLATINDTMIKSEKSGNSDDSDIAK